MYDYAVSLEGDLVGGSRAGVLGSTVAKSAAVRLPVRSSTVLAVTPLP